MLMPASQLFVPLNNQIIDKNWTHMFYFDTKKNRFWSFEPEFLFFLNYSIFLMALDLL